MVGKRLMRIRVVRLDGSPVTAFESAVRNLLRVVDFLPSCYPVGVMCMLIDRQHRRLGDLAAGTVLVRDQQFDLTKYSTASATTSLSAQDLELIANFLARFDVLDGDARLRLGRSLAARFGATDAKGFDEQAVRGFLTGRLQR